MDQRPEMIASMIDPILIYQMGKVGSSSVYRSLKLAGVPNSIFHVHQLSAKGIARKEQWLKHYNALHLPGIAEDLLYIKKLREWIAAHRSEFQWKIITMTRDPLSVELSSFFENIEVYGPEVFDAPKKLNVEKAIDTVTKNVFHSYDADKDYFCNWFAEELEAVFAIDVYAAPYDFDRGYSIITRDTASAVVIRLEDLGRSFRPAMADFLKVPNLELAKDNAAENKPYWNEYRKVLEKFSISLQSFDRIYSSRYARHFYPPGEREKSKQKWVADAVMGRD